MKKSPFDIKRFQDTYALLELQVPDVGNTATDATGNVLPAAKIQQYRAYLKPASKDPRQVELPGASVSQCYVRGYLVEPMDFPPGISPPLEVSCAMNGRKGKLQLEPAIARPFGSERYTGTAIQGWFTEVK